MNLDVYFERKKDGGRSKNFFYEKLLFPYRILTDKNDYILYKKGIQNLEQYSYILIYDYSTKTAMKLMQISIRKHIPYYINCDGAFINHNFFKTLIKKYFISHASGCFANGIHAKKYFIHYGAKEENIYLHNFSTLFEKDILPVCIPATEKAILKQKLGLENKKTVITVGQFIYRKGFDILLKAWERLSYDANLIILGGGEKEDEYWDFIATHHLTNVTLLGFKAFDEVLEYFKACDLFALPTREDIWGLVINEAMASGLPVITTDQCIAGLELIDNGKNGYIVPVDNVEILREKIQCVLENDTLASSMGKASLERIRPYTIENIASSHIAVLQQQYGE